MLEILTENVIFGIVYFREIILKSSRNVSETTPKSRPNWITDPRVKLGSARISVSHETENGVSRWWQPNLEIYSQKDHFGFICEMIYQFLGMVAKNY